MTAPTGPALFALLNSTDALDQARAALVATGALDGIKDALYDAARALPEQFEEVPPRVLAVWLATAYLDGVRTVRDWQAGLGESEGLKVGDLGAAAGQTDTSHTRRHLRHMRDMARAVDAADLSRTDVWVSAYGYDFAAKPQPRGTARGAEA